MYKFWQTAGFQPIISGFQAPVTPNTCFLQDTNDSADLNLRVMGILGKGKNRLLNFILSFRNFFSTENNHCIETRPKKCIKGCQLANSPFAKTLVLLYARTCKGLHAFVRSDCRSRTHD